MSDLRNFEISYTKDGDRKTFVHQADHFYEDDEWQVIVLRFGIPMKDQAWGSQTRQTFRTMCIDSGYTDVSYVEIP